MIYPSYEEYLELAQTARIVPIVQKINGDIFTPISVFQKFDAVRIRSFLRVSSAASAGCYSIMGRNPILRFTCWPGKKLYSSRTAVSILRSFGPHAGRTARRTDTRV